MFGKDTNAILKDILTDYEGYTGKSPSTEVMVRASMLASGIWGLYNQIDNEILQRFPDTADTANLVHHAFIYGLSRLDGESDQALLNRLLNQIRKPPAGGNANDYETWAKECRVDANGAYVVPSNAVTAAYSDVGNAFCYPNAQGPGTVDVLIQLSVNVRIIEFDGLGYVNADATDIGKTVTGLTSGDTGTLLAYDNTSRLWWVRRDAAGDMFDAAEVCDIGSGVGQGTSIGASYTDIAYPALLTAVENYIESVMPIGVDVLRVLAVSRVVQNITMEGTGDDFDAATAKSDIIEYVNALEPDDVLYRTQLQSICISNDATNATFPAPATPAADVTPAQYQVVRAGTVTVTGV